jgi:hypothetical protein
VIFYDITGFQRGGFLQIISIATWVISGFPLDITTHVAFHLTTVYWVSFHTSLAPYYDKISNIENAVQFAEYNWLAIIKSLGKIKAGSF